MSAMPTCVLAKDIRQPQYLKLLSNNIDGCIGGGFRSATVTELCGEGGSGKTQICVQLLLTVQLPPSLGGLYGSVIYVGTDYIFPSKRLVGIRKGINDRVGGTEGLMSFDNVHVSLVESCETLMSKLVEVRDLCESLADTERHVRLLVVDSVAALFRSQFSNTKEDMWRRSKCFATISSKLNELAYTFNLVIVVTNQVTCDLQGTRYCSNNVVLKGTSGPVQPALGLSWANCVTNRFFVGIGIESGGSETKRLLQVLYSPYLAPMKCEFKITRGGIE